MLTVCAACERHVGSHELTCPFCGAELSPEARGEATPAPAGLSRSTLFALGAAGVLGTALAVSSCAVYGGSPPPYGYGGFGGSGAGGAGMGGAGGGDAGTD